jgi:hypothetical protein
VGGARVADGREHSAGPRHLLGEYILPSLIISADAEGDAVAEPARHSHAVDRRRNGLNREVSVIGRAKNSAGAPRRLRSFDPVRLADFEYQAWVGYYLRRWPQVLVAAIGLVRVGFGMSWSRTLRGAWLVLRANQLWAPSPDNDPAGAEACMRRFYALVRLTHGDPASPARAAELEVTWWRVHREQRPSVDGAEPAGELVSALTSLYCYVYSEPEAALRPAAVERARAMDLSDQWVQEGCRPDSGLLPREHAALVRSYAALLAAVHH